jgi:hypothetical protein
MAAGVAILVGIILLALASIAFAQVSSNHDLSWHIIGGGGGQMASAGHTLNSTLGQPATDPTSSDEHALCSGFWCAEAAGFKVYLPLVLRNSISSQQVGEDGGVRAAAMQSFVPPSHSHPMNY